jgi:hypothetical protein
MSPTGFEPIIRTSERPYIHALDRTATRIGSISLYTTEMEPFLALNVENLYLIRIYCEQSAERNQQKLPVVFCTLNTEFPLPLHSTIHGSCAGVRKALKE